MSCEKHHMARLKSRTRGLGNSCRFTRYLTEMVQHQSIFWDRLSLKLYCYCGSLRIRQMWLQISICPKKCILISRNIYQVVFSRTYRKFTMNNHAQQMVKRQIRVLIAHSALQLAFFDHFPQSHHRKELPQNASCLPEFRAECTALVTIFHE